MKAHERLTKILKSYNGLTLNGDPLHILKAPPKGCRRVRGIDLVAGIKCKFLHSELDWPLAAVVLSRALRVICTEHLCYRPDLDGAYKAENHRRFFKKP